MKDADIAKQLLESKPMTRRELECKLGTTQQQANRLLLAVGAHVVGSVRAPRQGRPAPIYGFGDADDFCSQSVSLANLSSVWDLGARA